MKALILFSGGQDSTTCLIWAKKRFKDVEAITFDYGQRHSIELACSQEICKAYQVPQHIVDMKFLSQLNSNALTDDSIAMKKDGGMNNLPSTFVPGRNALFLTIAASYAVPRGILDIVIGACQVDFSGYPDCRSEFIDSQKKTLSLAMDKKLKVHAPLMNLSKGEIFGLAYQLGGLETIVENSHTCYEGDRAHKYDWGYGCNTCPACELRRAGYENYIQGKQHG